MILIEIIEKRKSWKEEKNSSLCEDSDNIENKDVKGYMELNMLSDILADYEEATFIDYIHQ